MSEDRFKTRTGAVMDIVGGILQVVAVIAGGIGIYGWIMGDSSENSSPTLSWRFSLSSPVFVSEPAPKRRGRLRLGLRSVGFSAESSRSSGLGGIVPDRVALVVFFQAESTEGSP